MTPATLSEVRNGTGLDDEHEDGAEAPDSTPEPEGAGDDQTGNDSRDGLSVEGDRQLSLGIGGDLPDKATIKLTGGEFDVVGEFPKGTRARFVVEGPISEVGARDLMDRKTGTVTGTVRFHSLKIDSVERID